MANFPRLMLALVVGLTTAGCSERVVVKTDFCTPWRAIYVSRSDVLSNSTATSIKNHDETGVKLGCWPAPAKAKAAPKK